MEENKRKKPNIVWIALFSLSVILLFASLAIPLCFIPNTDIEPGNSSKKYKSIEVDKDKGKKAGEGIIKGDKERKTIQTNEPNILLTTESGIEIKEVGSSQFEISNGNNELRLVEIKNVETLEGNKYLIDSNAKRLMTFPYGNGQYSIKVYEIEVMGDRYLLTKLSSDRVKVDGTYSHETLTNSSFYCNYENESELISEISNELGITDLDNRDEITDKVFDYMSKYEIDESLLDGRIQFSTSDIKQTYNSKAGVCLDIATLELAILRYNGVESRMAIGYFDKDLHHAWVEVKCEDDWLICDSTLKIRTDMGRDTRYSALEYN